MKRREKEENELAKNRRRRSDASESDEAENLKIKSRFHIVQKDQKAERLGLLKLAIDWNCIDIAKEFIFRNSANSIMVIIFISISSSSDASLSS